MKRMIVLILAAALLLATISCTFAEENRFITIRDWLDAKGECGECMLLLKITQILNPVLAVAEDDSGSINLFSGNGEELQNGKIRRGNYCSCIIPVYETWIFLS